MVALLVVGFMVVITVMLGIGMITDMIDDTRPGTEWMACEDDILISWEHFGEWYAVSPESWDLEPEYKPSNCVAHLKTIKYMDQPLGRGLFGEPLPPYEKTRIEKVYCRFSKADYKKLKKLREEIRQDKARVAREQAEVRRDIRAAELLKDIQADINAYLEKEVVGK